MKNFIKALAFLFIKKTFRGVLMKKKGEFSKRTLIVLVFCALILASVSTFILVSQTGSLNDSPNLAMGKARFTVEDAPREPVSSTMTAKATFNVEKPKNGGGLNE